MLTSGLLDKAMAKTTDDGIMEVVETEENRKRSSANSGISLDTNSTKFKAAAIAGILLVGFVLMQLVLGFSMGDYQVAIANAEVDEDNNDLKFQILIGTPMFKGAPSDPVSLTISYGDEVVWSGKETPSSTTMWIEVPFSDFYSGNSRATGSSGADTLYSIGAELNGNSAVSLELDSEMMDRTVTEGGGELIAKTESTGSEEKNGLNHVGAQMRIETGVGDPVNEELLLGISSDYSVEAAIIFGGSVEYTYPKITVDGQNAQWSTSGGYETGTGAFEGQWLTLSGTELVLGEAYIPRSLFYENGDGCYKIQLTVTHVSPFDAGGQEPLVFTSDGYEFFWDYNENRDAESDPGPDGEYGTDDDVPGEPYKATGSC
mgnify:CR=1 FL=1